MIPFKVFDRDKKVTWLIINFHATPNGGQYLAALEDDSTEKDGNLHLLDAEELTNYRLIGFADLANE